jgi:hypothetical protein
VLFAAGDDRRAGEERNDTVAPRSGIRSHDHSPVRAMNQPMNMRRCHDTRCPSRAAITIHGVLASREPRSKIRHYAGVDCVSVEPVLPLSLAETGDTPWLPRRFSF